MEQVPKAALIVLRTGTTPSPPGGQDSRHLILLRSVPFHTLFPRSGASGEREIQLSELRTSCPADLQKSLRHSSRGRPAEREPQMCWGV